MTKPRLKWHQNARADLLAIIDYISDDDPDAALALLDRIEAKVAQLVDHPKIYQAGRVEGTREMLVRKSYVVVYVEKALTVTVLRVLHGAQMWPR